MVGARADRADDLVRLRGGEDETDVLRWLLHDLEQGVEALPRDHVRLVDDVDLVSVAHRPERRLLAQLAGVVDAPVGGGVDLDDVDGPLTSGGELAARGALAAGLLGRPLRTVEGPGQDASARGLAAPARAREEVGVVDPVVAQRRPERPGDVVLADDGREGVRPVAAVERKGGFHGTDTNRRRRQAAPPLGAPGRGGGRRDAEAPRAPSRARLPLLPSGPGGVRQDAAARGVGQSLGHAPAGQRTGGGIPDFMPPGADRYPLPRRIRLVAYGARLESGLG